jgi:hypothetical protein
VQTDLDWIPFALGLLALLTLRYAAIGNVRTLIDLVVVAGYVASFAFARFIYKLWYFGHSLAPDAPIKLEPFTPAVIGKKQIATSPSRAGRTAAHSGSRHSFSGSWRSPCGT